MNELESLMAIIKQRPNPGAGPDLKMLCQLQLETFKTDYRKLEYLDKLSRQIKVKTEDLTHDYYHVMLECGYDEDENFVEIDKERDEIDGLENFVEKRFLLYENKHLKKLVFLLTNKQ